MAEERIDTQSATQADRDLLRFAEAPETGAEVTVLPVGPGLPGHALKLLVVDDEDEVHTVTRLVLKSYEFEGKGLNILSAWSGAGARQIIRDNPDIALILLDVVMEREDSGLRLIHYIRDELGNKNVRIILRTGQPGQAPEQEVVAQYDINDYKAKTELTAQKLYTTVTSSLRSWRDIQALEHNRRGLQKVIDAGSALFEWRSQRHFAAGILERLISLAGNDHFSTCGGHGGPDGDGTELDFGGAALAEEHDEQQTSGLVARRSNGEFVVLAGAGLYADRQDQAVSKFLPETVDHMIQRASRQGTDFFFNNSFVSCIKTDNGEQVLFLLRGQRFINSLDRDLVRIYMANVAMAFHNVSLSQEIIETQKEIIHTLGEVVETRSRETANHVLRVGKMAHLLAERMDLDPEEAAILRLAAPMHDVGKVGIPDAILNKPAKLTESEYKVMRTHTTIGNEILGKSERRIMRSAALVALQHHERWDGTGYPHGLKEEEIHIYGRITSLVDVFDALSSKRVYREAQDLGDVVHYLRDQRGRHFDPALVDCFLAHLTEFVAIVRSHPDQSNQREEKGTA